LIRDRLKIAQSRQKSLLIQSVERWPMRWAIEHTFEYRHWVKGKLAPRFVGPFKILACKGEIAYELELPESLSAVHNVFHVS
jgi:hypothetical protein